MVRRGCKLKLYLKYFSMQLKSILEYRKTFIISCFGQTATSIFSLLAIMFLFNKFGNVNGYTFDEVLICFAISFLGFSIAECFFRAFDQFDKMISNGEFDRALVRPRNLTDIRNKNGVFKIWKMYNINSNCNLGNKQKSFFMDN